VGYFTSTRAPNLAVGASVVVSRDKFGGPSPLPIERLVGVSDDGRYVAFDGVDLNGFRWGAEIPRHRPWTYVRDVALGWTAESWNSDYAESTAMGMSAAGDVLVFEACYVDGDVQTLVIPPFGGRVRAIDYEWTESCGSQSAVSSNGLWLVHTQGGTLHQRSLADPAAASTDLGETCADATCRHLSISDDGRYVAYESADAVYRYDVTADTSEVVASWADHPSARQDPYDPSMSADGRYVVFSTDARILPADVNASRDVYLKDMTSGTTTLVTADGDGNAAGGESTGPRISADGSTVVFSSAATDVGGATAGGSDAQVFAWGRVSGVTTRLTQPATDGARYRRADHPVVSASGAWVAYLAEEGLRSSPSGTPQAVLMRVR
jgi:hypothetical protein